MVTSRSFERWGRSSYHPSRVRHQRFHTVISLERGNVGRNGANTPNACVPYRRAIRGARIPFPGCGRSILCANEITQLPFLTFNTCLRSPSVAVSIAPFITRLRMNPGIGTDRSMVMSNLTLVLSPSGVSVYDASWAFN